MTRTQSDEIKDALNIATALATAVQARFIAPEHGANIFKAWLKQQSIDVKPITKDAQKA